MPTPTPDTFKVLLGKLVKTPELFTADDLTVALNLLCTPDVILPAQSRKTAENLAAAADTFRARAVKIVLEDGDKDFVVDIVGTGGDGHNTFNVSTTAAIVAAGAGARVIKHGSRASTSSSGSADLLERLDCLFVPPTPGTVVPIARVPFTFILAPDYHPSLATIAPYRRALPFRTLFNVLGPLINPARPKGMRTSTRSAVQGTHGCGRSKTGRSSRRNCIPNGSGYPSILSQQWRGGTATENAETLKALLRSGENIPEHLTPILHFVLLNASALLVVAGLAENYKHGVRLALESMTSGAAWRALEAFRDTGRLAMSQRQD
ncbi:glycosyl transferase [Pisolithus microcarpus]|nr:glycosyl transferase [Pisolithus microcarpus]